MAKPIVEGARHLSPKAKPVVEGVRLRARKRTSGEVYHEGKEGGPGESNGPVVRSNEDLQSRRDAKWSGSTIRILYGMDSCNSTKLCRVS